MEHLSKLSQEDQEYQSVYKTVKANKKLHKLPKGHPAQQFKMYWDVLSIEPEMPGLILYHGRIVVPQEAREEALENLHKQHCGETKTLQLARSLYFWP